MGRTFPALKYIAVRLPTSPECKDVLTSVRTVQTVNCSGTIGAQGSARIEAVWAFNAEIHPVRTKRPVEFSNMNHHGNSH